LGETCLDAEAMFFNKAWRKGARARLFAATYDPYGMYARMKEIAAKEAAVLAPRSEVEAKLDCGVVPSSEDMLRDQGF
jgi:hypothetical protein